MSSGFFFSFSPSKLLSHTYTRIRCISLCFVSFHDHWCPLVGRWVSIYIWYSVFHLSPFLVVDCVVWCVAGAYYSVRYPVYVSPCMYV